MSTSNVTLLHTHPLRRAKAVRSLVLQKARWYGLPNDQGRIVAEHAVARFLAGAASAGRIVCEAEEQIRLAARTRSIPLAVNATQAPESYHAARLRAVQASTRAAYAARLAAAAPRRRRWPSVLAVLALLALAAAGTWLAMHDPWLPATALARLLGDAA